MLKKNDAGSGPFHPAGTAQSDRWRFLSLHGQVLLCLAHDPGLSMRDVAGRLGITERAVQRTVRDLEAAGFLTRRRVGRRNRYTFHADRPMRHPLVAHREVRALLELIGPALEPEGEPVRRTDPGSAEPDRPGHSPSQARFQREDPAPETPESPG